MQQFAKYLEVNMNYEEKWIAKLNKLGNPTIRSLREDLGLTRKETAERMLIPIRTLEKWELGTFAPPTYVERFVIKELLSWKKKKN